MSEIFLNQVQLARRWHLSPRTLERWRWEGVGPTYLKVGGRVLYRLSDIEYFEKENTKSIHSEFTLALPTASFRMNGVSSSR